MSDITLVLEGGGMRGVFTAGFLDYCLQHDIEIPSIFATSAGASNSISFVSRQPMRAKTINIDYSSKYRYIGWLSFLKSGHFVDFDFLFHTVPEKLFPLDIESFLKSKTRYVSVATDCLTGLPRYFEKGRSYQEILSICRATCSLPILCPPVFIDGIPYLDGGITDSIPIKKAISEGSKNIVILLTHPLGFRKPAREINLPFFIYSKYPLLKAALRRRNFEYNKTLDFIEALEAQKKLRIIRPHSTHGINRLECDPARLTAFYNEGIQAASRFDF